MFGSCLKWARHPDYIIVLIIFDAKGSERKSINKRKNFITLWFIYWLFAEPRMISPVSKSIEIPFQP